jgi:hypothetical protein
LVNFFLGDLPGIFELTFGDLKEALLGLRKSLFG